MTQTGFATRIKYGWRVSARGCAVEDAVWWAVYRKLLFGLYPTLTDEAYGFC